MKSQPSTELVRDFTEELRVDARVGLLLFEATETLFSTWGDSKFSLGRTLSLDSGSILQSFPSFEVDGTTSLASGDREAPKRRVRFWRITANSDR